MAVITEKDRNGQAIRIRSSTFPLTDSDERKAVELDAILAAEIPRIESELVQLGLLPKLLPREDAPTKSADIRTWWELGMRLAKLLDDTRIVPVGELPWVYEAISMYASRRIARKDRGPSRLHFDYCVQIAALPWEHVRNLTWADWVFCMDSKGLGREPRFRMWLSKRITRIGRLGRHGFRELAKRLNAMLKNKDTSVFSDTELFERYDSVLDAVSRAVGAGSV